MLRESQAKIPWLAQVHTWPRQRASFSSGRGLCYPSRNGTVSTSAGASPSGSSPRPSSSPRSPSHRVHQHSAPVYWPGDVPGNSPLRCPMWGKGHTTTRASAPVLGPTTLAWCSFLCPDSPLKFTLPVLGSTLYTHHR